MVGVDNNNL